MTRLGWFAGFTLLSFWIAGLAAFFLGGLSLAGHVVQAFLAVVLWWVGRELYREYHETVKAENYREQIFRTWQENSRRKGME